MTCDPVAVGVDVVQAEVGAEHQGGCGDVGVLERVDALRRVEDVGLVVAVVNGQPVH